MFFVLLLLLVATAAAQRDLAGRNEINAAASVYLHVQIDALFYKKTSPVGMLDRVVFGFAKGGLLMPAKLRLEDEAASETNLVRPYIFSRATCVAVSLNQTGAVGLATPALAIDNADVLLYQFTQEADFFAYSDFSRPFFEFEVTAFKQANATSTSCAPVAADGAVVKQNFTGRLCFTEDSFCNVYVGGNSDGWIYFGGGNTSTTANFGVQVFPRWNWTGTREEFTLNATNYLDVRPVDPSSDAAGTFTLSKTYSVPFEFNDCKVQAGGVVVFNIDENGNLVRYLSCNSLELSENAYFVFDFNNKFDEAKMAQWKLPGVDKWNFTLPPVIRVKYASAFTVRVDPTKYLEPYLELNGLPPAYARDGANWLTTIEYRTDQFDLIRTWFTVVKSVTAAPGVPTTPATTAAPTTTRTPAPTVAPKPCPRDCSSAGSCNTNTGVCDCGSGFVVDAVLGCKSIAESTTTMAPGATTTTIRTVAGNTLAPPPTPSTTSTLGREATFTSSPTTSTTTSTSTTTTSTTTASATTTRASTSATQTTSSTTASAATLSESTNATAAPDETAVTDTTTAVIVVTGDPKSLDEDDALDTILTLYVAPIVAGVLVVLIVSVCVTCRKKLSFCCLTKCRGKFVCPICFEINGTASRLYESAVVLRQHHEREHQRTSAHYSSSTELLNSSRSSSQVGFAAPAIDSPPPAYPTNNGTYAAAPVTITTSQFGEYGSAPEEFQSSRLE